MNTALSLICKQGPEAMDQYARLRDTAKTELALWSEAILELSALTLSRSHALTRAYEKWAARLSCSARSVRRKFSEFRNGTADYQAGDWRILVNHSKAGSLFHSSATLQHSGAPTLPHDFLEFWRGLCGDNQRKHRPQYRALRRRLDQWRAGDPTAAIPGYSAPPPNTPGKDHPAGWSERNLYRTLKNAQTRVEIAIDRYGTAAGNALLPSIPGTRVGVRFMEYLMFDDVWHDRKIVVPGYTDPVRLLMLGCLDYASGVYIKFGLRPELPTDGGTRERLKERDMKWLVAMVLEQHGFPRDYDMHLVLEHGTATLRDADCRALFDWSGGRIKPCYSTMEGQLVLAWDERGKGNPRAKAALESWHNAFHNEAAALIGQVGKDRDHSPAALAGMEREARSLATASAFLSPELRAKLKFPFADREQAHFETCDLVHRLNNRTDHKCEGFETILEWRLKGLPNEPWRPEAALLPLLEGRVTASPSITDFIEWRSRKESPWERLQKLSTDVPRGTITPGLLCKFYEDSRVEKSLEDDGTFRFVHDGRELLFAMEGRVTASPTLKSGVRYLLHFPPLDPDHVHITDEHGAYITTWPRVRRIQRGDHKALAAAIAQKQAALHTAVANVRRRHAGRIESELERMRHNAETINQALPLSNSQRSDAPTLQHSNAGTNLAAAYQAEADLARERERTREILSGQSTPSTESIESILSGSPESSRPEPQPPSVTDDELNSIL